MKINKEEKWKTKDGIFETKESASMSNMKLPHFSKRREFDADKRNPCEAPDEKCDIITDQYVCQKTGLDMLNSTQQFQLHESLMSMVSSG